MAFLSVRLELSLFHKLSLNLIIDFLEVVFNFFFNLNSVMAISNCSCDHHRLSFSFGISNDYMAKWCQDAMYFFLYCCFTLSLL